MADARNHVSPNDDLAMPTDKEMRLAHQNTLSTVDDKHPDSPQNSLTDDAPKKKEKFRWRNFWICFLISLGKFNTNWHTITFSTTKVATNSSNHMAMK